MLTAFAIDSARRTAANTGEPWLACLATATQLENETLMAELGMLLGWPTYTMRDLQSGVAAFDVLPFNDALQRHCLPLRLNDQLFLVLADPFDNRLQDWAQARIPEAFLWALAHPDNVTAYLAAFEDTQRAMDGVHTENSDADLINNGRYDISLKTISQDSSPVVKLLNSTLYDALKAGASDIHLETTAHGLTIKYRVDGVLSSVGGGNGIETAEQVISRLKVMAELDIAERRIPQDGRFKAALNNREIDFRVSIIPSLFGEDAVLRVLDRKTLNLGPQGMRLDTLGLDDETCSIVRRLSNEPYGMVLVTGPTGSGKTTTLYAAVSEINHGQDKIITIEDPVEYQLPGVLQIPVNEKKGLTFAKGLRAVLRHDPDKIMVGEIRDSETAQIAIQAALTGHLVFTTVHANSVFDVIGRFMHMGVDPYSFVSALNGILAQRLLRLTCPHCAETTKPDLELLELSGLHLTDTSTYRFAQGRGCGQCRGSGYKGRRAIAEVLRLNDELRELIISRAPVTQLKAAARKHGMRNLRDAAVALVKTGDTTLQEINRVTFVD